MKNSFSEQEGLTEINMIPLIDIMLVLVVILLMTTHFIVSSQEIKGLHVSLPNTKSAAIISDAPVRIELDSNGQLRYEDALIDISTLQTLLSDIPRERMILISADKELRLQTFITVMDTLKRQGFSRINVQTRS